MNKKLLTLLFSLLLISCTPPEEPYDTDETNDNDTPVTDIDPNDQINFPDSVLRACIEALTGKGSGDPIYAKDVAEITEVECMNVSDLTGMEYFSQIRWVHFSGPSSINSLKPLASLLTMEHLQIVGGGVKNFSDISGLTNLSNISYITSELEDISALTSMNNLTSITLSENKIKSMGALSTLPNIEMIQVSDNPTLTTIGAQFTAPKLTELNISNCGLTSLNELSGLPELMSINASTNYLTEISVITTLPKLNVIGQGGNCITEEAMQVYVDWWNAKHPSNPTTLEFEMEYQDPQKCQ